MVCAGQVEIQFLTVLRERGVQSIHCGQIFFPRTLSELPGNNVFLSLSFIPSVKLHVWWQIPPIAFMSLFCFSLSSISRRSNEQLCAPSFQH